MASPGKLRSDEWPGAFKLAEECSEVTQAIMKIMGGSKDPHLIDHLEDEIADVYAALGFFMDHNALDFPRIATRIQAKRDRWDAKRNGVKANGR